MLLHCFGFVSGFFLEQVHYAGFGLECGFVFGACWDEVFVAFLYEPRRVVDGEFHFAFDDHAPLRITVAVLWHFGCGLKFEENQLLISGLEDPGFYACEWQFSFGQLGYY